VFRQLGVSARRHGDTLLGLLAEAALRDAERSRRWTEALVTHMSQEESNVPQLTQWVGKWQPLAEKAVRVYADELAENAEAADTAVSAVQAFQRHLGLGL